MNGEKLYQLYVQKNLEVMNSEVDKWEFLEVDDQRIWNAMSDSIAVEFDPDLARSSVAERLASAESIIRQAARDTYGEDMTPNEFAERSSYDS